MFKLGTDFEYNRTTDCQNSSVPVYSTISMLSRTSYDVDHKRVTFCPSGSSRKSVENTLSKNSG